jgi:hypothetical protein
MTQPACLGGRFSRPTMTLRRLRSMGRASEPVHVQMNLPDRKIVLVNNGPALTSAIVNTKVTSLDRVLADQRCDRQRSTTSSPMPLRSISRRCWRRA